MDVSKPVGLWGAYVMGLAFAFGWTPCIGPILAAILAVAASEATVAKGAGLLAVYSLGLGIPFLAAAFAVEPFAAFLARFRAYLPMVEKVMGALLVLTGIAFLTGFVSEASYWLSTFPVLGGSVSSRFVIAGLESECMSVARVFRMDARVKLPRYDEILSRRLRPVRDRPARGFPGLRELQHAEIVEAAADDLQADRQPGCRVAGIDRHGRLLGHVGRHREADVLERALGSSLGEAARPRRPGSARSARARNRSAERGARRRRRIAMHLAEAADTSSPESLAPPSAQAR